MRDLRNQHFIHNPAPVLERTTTFRTFLAREVRLTYQRCLRSVSDPAHCVRVLPGHFPGNCVSRFILG